MLADLHDPLTMPPALVKAHTHLDRSVDLCYRPQSFDNDRQRVEKSDHRRPEGRGRGVVILSW